MHKTLPRAIARARALYDAGEPLDDIADRLGMTTKTFRKYRLLWRWPARCRARSLRQVAITAIREPRDGRGLVRVVRIKVEEALASLPPGDSEPHARTLSNLTRTLAALRALEAKFAAGHDETRHDDQQPIDIADLRRELARRLHRLSEEGNA